MASRLPLFGSPKRTGARRSTRWPISCRPWGVRPAPWSTSQGVLDLRFAPGSDRYAYLRPRGGDQNNGNAVYVGNGGARPRRHRGDGAQHQRYAWLPGGHGLLLTGDLGTDAVMWHLPIGGTARRLDLGDVQVKCRPSVSRHGAVAFVGSTPDASGRAVRDDLAAARPQAADRPQRLRRRAVPGPHAAGSLERAGRLPARMAY